MELEGIDRLMRLLTEEDPQRMVSFLLKDAIYEEELDRELALQTYEGELSPEVQAQVLNADELYHVLWNDEHIVLHLEFRRYGEIEMPRKIWECNALTSIITGKPVYSVVIYAAPEPLIPDPVYQIRLPDGEVIQSFTFNQIKLWEIESEVFGQPQFVGLHPLMPLTKDGLNREKIDRVCRTMEEAERAGLFSKRPQRSRLVLRHKEDWQWLKKTTLDFFKDIPGYQEAIEEGYRKTFQQGMEQI